MQNRLKDLVLGALVGLFLSVPVLYKNGYFLPIPYSYVELVGEEQYDDLLLLSFNFEKNACVFEDMRVYGEYLGRWSELRYKFFSDVDWGYVFSQKGEGDRLKGSQTLNIAVETTDVEYSRIEVRTRHLCKGKVVDRVFATIRPDRTPEEE